jgi:hypothetical protein
MTSRRAFEAALAERESGELFEGLVRALCLGVEYAGSIGAYERAFVAYSEECDALPARPLTHTQPPQRIDLNAPLLDTGAPGRRRAVAYLLSQARSRRRRGCELTAPVSPGKYPALALTLATGRNGVGGKRGSGGERRR